MINAFDTSVLDFFLSIRNPVLTPILRVLTWMGEAGVIWIVIGLLFLIRKQTRLVGAMILLALLLEVIIGNGIIKNIVARHRPFESTDIDTIIRHPWDYSFPSGHTASAVAAIIPIWYGDWKKGIAAFVLGVVIAASRMYFYVHYPTDIIGGLVLGLILGSASIFIINKLKDREKFRRILRLNENNDSVRG